MQAASSLLLTHAVLSNASNYGPITTTLLMSALEELASRAKVAIRTWSVHEQKVSSTPKQKEKLHKSSTTT